MNAPRDAPGFNDVVAERYAQAAAQAAAGVLEAMLPRVIALQECGLEPRAIAARLRREGFPLADSRTVAQILGAPR
jgi:hypothetical protein